MKIRMIAPALASLLGAASADLSIYEPFAYESTAEANNGRFFGDSSQPYDTGIGLGSWSHRDAGGNGTANNIAPTNEGDIADEGVTFTDLAGNELPVNGNAYERRQRVGQVAASAPIDPAATAELTADNSTMWMSFLFQDFGFSGPDFGIGLHSEMMVSDDNQGLEAPGFGVGFGIVARSGQQRNIRTAVYNSSIGASQLAAEATPTFNGPAASDVFLLALKVNWNPQGTPDEIFAFIITDITTEPDENEAMVMDTFDFDLATQQSLDVLNFSDTQVGYVDEIRVGTTFDDVMGRESQEPLKQLEINASGNSLEISWESQVGKLYTLRSAADPSTSSSAEWAVFEENADITATPPRNLLVLPLPDDSSRLFVVEEFTAPPEIYFSDDLESGADGWDTLVNDENGTTEWILGMPAGSTGPLMGANDSLNAFTTNLGDYGPGSNISLRSPEIDLSAASTAQLSFEVFRDGDGLADTASVRFLRAGSYEQLGAPVQIDMTVLDKDYRLLTTEVTQEALGEAAVIVEWTFQSDDSVDAFSGLTIDNIVIGE
tara:strand:- start:4693 stop:6333 length:1641 start_codon:yes stop_codon:yes gene_type:complete